VTPPNRGRAARRPPAAEKGGAAGRGRATTGRGRATTGRKPAGRNPAGRGTRAGATGQGREPRPWRKPGAGELGGDQVEGRRAVRELLAVGRRPVRCLWLAQGLDPSPQLDEIEALAAKRRVRVEVVSRARLESEARTDAPQGVLAVAAAIEPVPLDDLCASGRAGARPFLLVASGLTDPRNLGALLRSAECAGVTGVVLARHRAAHLSPTVAKVAAGALEHLEFAVVGGIPTALDRLRALDVWVIGLAGEAERSLYELSLAGMAVALVVGSEDKGLAPLVRRRCDEVVAIPQQGALPSLNVGVAGAVACFEVARQRLVDG